MAFSRGPTVHNCTTKYLGTVPPHCYSQHWRWDPYHYSVSKRLFSMSFLCPLLWWSFSISPQFSPRKNCSICRCRLRVSMGKGELRVFLRHHLGPLFLNGKFLFLFVDNIWGTTFSDFNEKFNYCLYFSFQLVILMECLRMLCYAWSRIMNTY